MTLIKPRISGNRQQFYLNFLHLEPLSIATVAGLLPESVSVSFHDDRYEAIPFTAPTDFVGITVDTYSAKRAYALSAEYRQRGVPVVLGGFHPTLAPDEALEHADCIVVGEAENIMGEMIDDFRHHRLKRIYTSPEDVCLDNVRPRRDIFRGKPYPGIKPVEFGRGCKYRCDFCCIHEFYGGRYRSRPVAQVIDEIRSLKRRLIMFTDDNIVNSPERAKELFRALIPLRIRWVSQSSIDAAGDEEMLSLMRRSGCIGLLIGLESLSGKSLAGMNKRADREWYEEALRRIRFHGLAVNGSFVWGYDGDTPESLAEECDFAIRQRFIFAGFNHFMPSPGTRAIRRLREENRLLYGKWWLDQEDYFGSPAFVPQQLTPDELARARFEARRKFYRISSIVYRAFDFRTHARNVYFLLFFLFSNLRLRRGRRREEEDALPSRLLRQSDKGPFPFP